MNELMNEIISTVLQIAVFTLIPLIFFMFRKDKGKTFAKYIGLYRPTWKSIRYALVTLILFFIVGIGLTGLDDGVKQIMLSPHSITGKLRLMGLSASSVVTLLIIALFKTSLSEEIFFRGFIAKRLIDKFGYQIGNAIQALLFGLIHLLLFWTMARSTAFALAFIFVFTSAAGWAIGYVNEKHAEGSIIPGWIAHGLGNAFSYSIIAFVL